VPLWPTTPFVLLAAWCYARGSERFRRWLHEHRRFGPIVRAWEDHGVIPPNAKVLSTVALIASVAIMTHRLGLVWGGVAALVAVAVMAFVLSRPSAIPKT
jgi:uncharacterized membrane protein YbaN (DUF454 family)